MRLSREAEKERLAGLIADVVADYTTAVTTGQIVEAFGESLPRILTDDIYDYLSDTEADPLDDEWESESFTWDVEDDWPEDE